MSVCNDNKSKPILILRWRLEVTDALINSDLAHKNKKLRRPRSLFHLPTRELA